jgi:hypothetical protein
MMDPDSTNKSEGVYYKDGLGMLVLHRVAQIVQELVKGAFSLVYVVTCVELLLLLTLSISRSLS